MEYQTHCSCGRKIASNQDLRMKICDLEKHYENASAACNHIAHKKDLLIQQAHRQGWEQAKREAETIAKQTDFPPSPKSYYTLGREDAAKAIASMEYKKEAKDESV